MLFSNLGYADESLDLARRAVGLDPLNADAYYDLGLVLWSLNRWTEMEAALRKAVALAPTAEQYHAVLAFALLGMGQYEEAEREAALEPEALWRSMIQALILAHRGKTTEALALARELESSFNHNEDVAEIYALVSKRDLAFAALERGYALHETSMPYVKVDIYLRNLHDDPRWPVFLRKMGLADDQLK